MVARWTSLAALAVLAVVAWCWCSGAASPAPPLPSPLDPAAAPLEPASAGAELRAADRTQLNAATTASPAAGEEPAAAAPKGTLVVVARTETGAALRGCHVEVGELTATTDDAGRAELMVDVGRVHVVVRADSNRVPVAGWQSVRAGVTTSIEVELLLRGSTSFWLQCVGAEDQKPVADAAVVVRRRGIASPAAELRTDRDGRCATHVDPAVDWLEVQAPGRAPRVVQPQRDHAAALQALVVPLERGADLRCVVVDTAERPIAQCRVSVSWLPWYLLFPRGGDVRGGPQDAEAKSDERGIATFRDLPADVSLDLRCTPLLGLSAAPQQSFVLAAGANERRIVMELGGEVRGTVVDGSGAPLPGAAVAWYPAEGATPRQLHDPDRGHMRAGAGLTLADASGAFRFECGPGEHWVGVVLTDGRAPSVGPGQSVEVPPGGLATVALTAALPLSIAGRAVDGRGQPVAGIVLNAEAGDDHVAANRTDVDGRFELKGLVAGEYRLTSDAYEGNLGLRQPVSANAGDRDLELRLEPVRGTLAGRIVDATTGAPATAWVWAQQRDGDEGIGAHCDLDGTFTYAGLAAGTWDILAHDTRHRCAMQMGVVVTAGSEVTTIQLAMQPGALLRPRHSTATAYRLEHDGQPLMGDGLEPGVPGQVSVLPGSWTVVFLADGAEIGRRTVDVGPGEDVVVALK